MSQILKNKSWAENQTLSMTNVTEQFYFRAHYIKKLVKEELLTGFFFMMNFPEPIHGCLTMKASYSTQ